MLDRPPVRRRDPNATEVRPSGGITTGGITFAGEPVISNVNSTVGTVMLDSVRSASTTYTAADLG